ncbi:MAG: hypothetical protein KDD47_02010 [Acidobacteria bacterium]|nr:hypothetical protein [Acidobacteriota bacterium]
MASFLLIPNPSPPPRFSDSPRPRWLRLPSGSAVVEKMISQVLVELVKYLGRLVGEWLF